MIYLRGRFSKDHSKQADARVVSEASPTSTFAYLLPYPAPWYTVYHAAHGKSCSATHMQMIDRHPPSRCRSEAPAELGVARCAFIWSGKVANYGARQPSQSRSTGRPSDPCTARLHIEPDAGARAALGEGPTTVGSGTGSAGIRRIGLHGSARGFPKGA